MLIFKLIDMSCLPHILTIVKAVKAVKAHYKVKREYISWLIKGLDYNLSAITEEDIDVFANHISSPGAMRAGFEYYRAFPLDAEQNRESAKTKITMPVLVLGGDIYPALGGNLSGSFALSSIQSLASNISGVTVPLSGH